MSCLRTVRIVSRQGTKENPGPAGSDSGSGPGAGRIYRAMSVLGYLALLVSLMWAVFSSFLFLNAKYDLLGGTRNGPPVVGEVIPEFTMTSLETGERISSRAVSTGKWVLAFPDSRHDRKPLVLEDTADGFADRSEGGGSRLRLIAVSKDGAGTLPAGFDAYACDDCLSHVRILPTYWLVDDSRIMDVIEGGFEEYSLSSKVMKLLKTPPLNKKVTLSPQVWRAILMPDEALRFAWQDNRVRELFRPTLERGSIPVSEVQLAYAATDSSIFYQIRFLDKVCPCSGYDSDSYNVADVMIDPLNGAPIDLDIMEGATADDIRY